MSGSLPLPVSLPTSRFTFLAERGGGGGGDAADILNVVVVVAEVSGSTLTLAATRWTCGRGCACGCAGRVL
jgi:hypothetical protein